MGKKNNDQNRSIIKVIGTDLAGISCLLLVPFVGPLPGPGGIPLLLTGLGLLSINHEWAKRWLHYVRKHSTSVRDIAFPNITWIKWSWDIATLLVFSVGLYLNFTVDHWLLKGLSIGTMAGATTLFMLNRNRIDYFDNLVNRKK